jgi:hypothetical protein
LAYCGGRSVYFPLFSWPIWRCEHKTRSYEGKGRGSPL